MIQALVCLALVIILAGHAVLAVIEAAIRMVGMGTVMVVIVIPVFAVACYLIG